MWSNQHITKDLKVKEKLCSDLLHSGRLVCECRRVLQCHSDVSRHAISFRQSRSQESANGFSGAGYIGLCTASATHLFLDAPVLIVLWVIWWVLRNWLCLVRGVTPERLADVGGVGGGVVHLKGWRDLIAAIVCSCVWLYCNYTPCCLPSSTYAMNSYCWFYRSIERDSVK